MHVLTREYPLRAVVVNSDFDITPTPLYVTRGSASSSEQGDLGATLGESPPAGRGRRDGSMRIEAIREYQIEKSNLRGRRETAGDDEVRRSARRRRRVELRQSQ